MTHLKLLVLNLFSDKEEIQFHMLSTGVHNRIVSKSNSAQIVTEDDWRVMMRNVQFRQKDLIHVTSAVPNAKLRYSASVLDLATTDCFFDHQDTKLDPKKMAAPEVDLLSSGSDAQSASQKACNSKGGPVKGG